MRATPGARQFSGRMMVIVGFVMLVLNAADYLFGWNQFGPWFVAVGSCSWPSAPAAYAAPGASD